VFISYRQSDGTEIANRITRSLRAMGVPVWRDVSDLPPGDTAIRLQEAIDRGISGAVVIVTEQVADSPVMQNVELPKLLELHRSNSTFALQILSNVWSGAQPDYSAPDQLLRLPFGTLTGIDQQPNNEVGIELLARRLASVRVNLHRAAHESLAFELSIQSRNEGRATDLTDAVLDLRFQAAADGRLPSSVAIDDLRAVSKDLPGLFVESGSTRATISGGAHLSISFAVAASLPSTRTPRFEVRQGFEGPFWDSVTASTFVGPGFQVNETRLEGSPDSSDLAVYVDVVPGGVSNAAFDGFWAENASRLGGALTLTARDRREISRFEGPALAAHINSLIRVEWGRLGNGLVHLFLRTPFPLASFLGWSSNTLPVLLYEWSSTGGPHYVPTVRVESGSLPGAVQ
jgi:hypothetical protein